MRAVLLLAVLMTALGCVAGAVGLTGYLVGIAIRSASDRRRGVARATPPPARGLVGLLIGYASAMVAIVGAAVWAQTAFWVVMASWSALAATTTAAVLRRRRSPG